MGSGDYNGKGDPAVQWGCVAAFIIGAPLLAFSIFVSALGDCIPDRPCPHGLIWWLAIPALLIAIASGAAVALLVKWIARRKGGDR